MGAGNVGDERRGQAGGAHHGGGGRGEETGYRKETMHTLVR
jgi:hypothetical protein